MTETNAERIEHLKEQLKINLMTNGDFKWLIEKAQELEVWQETARNYFGENIRLKNEIERLRETLEGIE